MSLSFLIYKMDLKILTSYDDYENYVTYVVSA